MPAAPSAVRARGLVKRYGDFVAVDGIDLEVPAGGCFGVLGPNGAGKTTAMRMITCTSPVSEGTLEVLGRDVRGDRRALKRRLGVVPQGDTLDVDLSVRENLTTFAAYHDVDRATAARRADELLDFVALAERDDAKVEELSGGMQRRLLIARALMNDPELVVLDEPTTGLDPQARHHVWQRLRSLKRRGVTLLLTTHYMEEAAQLCDRLVIMDRGRVVAEGAPAVLVHAHTAPRVVELQGAEDAATDVRALLDGLADDVEEVGDRVVVYTDDAPAVVARLRDARLPHATLVERDASLEDVFLRLTGHSLIEGTQ
ncbi:MAG TPA: ABC transporter ATP-binding protein [Egibacteraceae bacterium]|jgi:lipooligosaccharide transport system ATP-binding protein|nr:ABC transporter ATP-binding protein [Egibacteraceae bacterium]